jgi:peptidoglycan/xylan/chitin deacetylase (PgdA/CDA1 family)
VNGLRKLLVELGARAWRRLTGTIIGVSTAEAVAALTFDDGPHPDYTPRLLNLLERYQVRATFFVVGEMAQRYPEILRRIARAGHVLGNHTWDHPSLPRLPRRERIAQVRAATRLLAPYGVALFRPPYGHQSLASHLEVLALGYRVLTWNQHAEDWKAHDADRLAARLSAELKPGNIILLHDSLYHLSAQHVDDRSAMLQAVDEFLARQRGRFRFVTVPELLRLGRPQLANWYQQGDVAWLNQLRGPWSTPRRYDPVSRF